MIAAAAALQYSYVYKTNTHKRIHSRMDGWYGWLKEEILLNKGIQLTAQQQNTLVQDG